MKEAADREFQGSWPNHVAESEYSRFSERSISEIKYRMFMEDTHINPDLEMIYECAPAHKIDVVIPSYNEFYVTKCYHILLKLCKAEW